VKIKAVGEASFLQKEKAAKEALNAAADLLQKQNEINAIQRKALLLMNEKVIELKSRLEYFIKHGREKNNG
jgi:hypothetical protein